MIRPLVVACATTLLLVTACSPGEATHGNKLTASKLARIEPGQTRDDVRLVFGTPSAVGTFDGDVWYYVSQRRQEGSLFPPKTIERDVIVVSFDDRGVVADVRELTLEDGAVVAPVERQTPTAGRELSIFEQLIGNVGRFSTEGGGASGM